MSIKMALEPDRRTNFFFSVPAQFPSLTAMLLL